MKAAVLTAINELVVREEPTPHAGPGEVVVKLKAAALNHRDVWIKAGQYAGLKFPCIPGSDGAGVVTEIGAGVEATWLDHDVIINPSFNWGASERAQGRDFSILGLPRAGTLAECIAVPAEQIAEKPHFLSWPEAAALPLAGLTAYRALFSRARLEAKERVLITGIGGGVALFALQFAVAADAEVWVTSSSPEKIVRAQTFGAKGGFNYREEHWAKAALDKVSDGFDVIVDSAGGDNFESLVDLAAPGGRLVFFGATRGNPPILPMRKVFWKQLSLLGTTMGSLDDWLNMTAHVGATQVKPIVSRMFPLDDAGEAFALMERGGQMGKIVLTMA